MEEWCAGHGRRPVGQVGRPIDVRDRGFDEGRETVREGLEHFADLCGCHRHDDRVEFPEIDGRSGHRRDVDRVDVRRGPDRLEMNCR
nr:hypothetical protein [Actinomycetota bacterium]NIT99279.1 hypothetical protein [Actinomycetota bacterium]NIU22874.1 hypothetical protein [Actinomycetota bacterium]NIU71206.1 hypothetical protein [Actinomycetota bacterium]NIV59493.1 hypothetical protein [Actinomycetota bacterium]